MPTELVSRIDLGLFYPGFRDVALEVLVACKKRGSSYYVLKTGGFRSFPEQAKLYFQGRTAPGPKVTNAKAGESCHNFAIAWDVCFDVDNSTPGLQPRWNAEDYRVLNEEATRLGLQSGVPFPKDPGHLQLSLIGRLKRKEIDILADLRREYLKTNDLKDAWKLLDAWGFGTP